MSQRGPKNRRLERRLFGRPAIALGLALVVASCGPAHDGAAPDDGRPRLAVVIVVDQLSQPGLERLRPLLSGGLKRILDGGASFVEARYRHACTLTAPGHATLTTGVHPRAHGIVGNEWYDRDGGRVVTSVSDDRASRSPRKLLVPGLGDWIQEHDRRSQVISISLKDRSAILLGGHRADLALWYGARAGAFTTSRHYRRWLPRWLRRFNANAPRDPGTWTPLPLSDARLRELGLADWRLDLLRRDFSHRLSPVPVPAGAQGFHRSPFADVELARLARAVIAQHELGADGAVDLLGLAFSAPDWVSHDFGPDSREYLDALLRLDRTLGELLEFLDARIGLDRVVFALSADHGTAPVPELGPVGGYPGGRLDGEESACLERARQALEDRLGGVTWVKTGIYLDHGGANAQQREAVERAYAREIESCPSVVKVWTAGELRGCEVPDSTFEELYCNAFYPPRSPDLTLQFREFFTPTAFVLADHGSPYDYDTHVPLVFTGPGVQAGSIPGRAEPADLAPTLAALLGIAAPDGLHGADRSRQLREP